MSHNKTTILPDNENYDICLTSLIILPNIHTTINHKRFIFLFDWLIKDFLLYYSIKLWLIIFRCGKSVIEKMFHIWYWK